MSNNRRYFTELGIKNTKQRNLIYDILKNSDKPLTAEDIYIKLISKSISLSTVYRVLDVFLSKNLIIKRNISDESKAMFEINLMEHKHHLICTKCKKILEIHGCPLENYQKILEKETNFDIFGHKLELYGSCDVCKHKSI